MNVDIYIGQDKLDLFNDETIEINSSVQNVNDITKNTTDFSKNFTVPATNNNNKILKHWYDFNIDNGFDARLKIDGRIEINGITFKYGKFNLNSVKITQGKPSSYSLIFYGNTISIVDLVSNDYLSDLDLSSYDHEYNDANVLSGLQTSLFSGAIKYTLLSKKRYYYNSDTVDDNKQTLTNHKNIADVPWAYGVNWSDLRASIKLINIIEAIESKYGITFTRDFFGRSEFTGLYLWLDNKKESEITTQIKLDFYYPGDIPSNVADFDYVNDTIKLKQFSIFAEFVEILFRVNTDPTYSPTEYKFIVKKNNETILEVNERNDNGYSDIIIQNPEVGAEYSAYIESSNLTIDSVYVQVKWKEGFVYTTKSTYTATQTITTQYSISSQIPQIKVIDFLKGLFSMFKLVVRQNKITDPFYVNTLNDYYSSGQLYDISQYVNISGYDVERGKLLNEIMYSYEEPQTILNKQFKENNNIAYGDNELILLEDMANPNSKKIDGEKEEIKLPFEQVLYERINDLKNNTKTFIQIGSIIDDKYEPVNIKPHIHYVNQGTGEHIKFKKNIGEESIYTYNIATHTNNTNDSPNYSLVFDREYNTYNGVAIENTLYVNYHAKYIEPIFNIKRRNIKYDAKLPFRILINLDLNDLILIDDNYFRINTWTYNLLNGIAKLDLINSFDNTINGFSASKTIINTDYVYKIESIYFTNCTTFIFDYAEAWILNVYNVDNNVYFEIDNNYTGFSRTAIITVKNSLTLQEIDITINQTSSTITADNNTITADNNIITADNG